MFKKITLSLATFLPALCFASSNLPTWQIVPNESSLRFSGLQNGAPVTGQFKTFTGEIHCDPTQLARCSAKIVVDINSLSASYNQVVEILKTTEWFNAKVYPQAIFQSKKFLKTGDKTYTIEGNLSIRGKTLPVTLNVSEEATGNQKQVFQGSTIIKRRAFDVGTGEWADTNTVKDDVQINFTLTAIKK